MNGKNSKIIFVEVDDTERYPPEISVINVLSEVSNYDLHICSLNPGEYITNFCRRYNVLLHNGNGRIIRKETYSGLSIARKANEIIKNRKKLWNIIDQLYCEDDIIWVNTFTTLKTLGKRLFQYKYVVHLLELLHETRLYYKFRYPKFKLGDYLQHAYRVIECEYNRACITKAWFNLDTIPVVLPNKLYLREQETIESKPDLEFSEVLEKLLHKKIILYQGILGPERPIEVFAEAVAELSDEYVMVVMSGDKLKNKFQTRNLYELGYVPAPNHLKITEKAFIGILTYQSISTGYSSNDCLNSIYCAPNKIYEYSKFGLPMIGNNIPGLKYTIEYSGSGICVDKMSKEKIKEAILKIDADYENYRNNALTFYNSIDIKKIIIDEILNE